MPLVGDRRAVIILFLILCFTVVAFSEIGLVKALVINADGSVDQPENVEQNGDLYVLTNDVSVLVVRINNVTVDGAGHTIYANFLAVLLDSVNNVTLRNCIITGNGLQTGIQLLQSSNCVISNNLIEKTVFMNPKLTMTGGIVVQGGSSHIISGNNLTNNLIGIVLDNGEAGNIVVGNSIKDNSNGIRFYSSFNNIVYNNNFINNTRHVSGGESTLLNIWDSGGTVNYWSNYTGQDTNGDNIGDSPHIIYENNQDNYPLITPNDIEVIPEFPSWIILPLFLVATLFALIIRKKIRVL